MIEFYNNRIFISHDDPNIKSIKSYLYKILDKPRKVLVGKHNNGKPKYKEVGYSKLYDEDEKGNIYTLPGLSIYFEKYNHVDYRTSKYDFTGVDSATYRKMSDRVTLRDDQVQAVNYILKHKLGVVQLPTGIGKSEIIAGLMKTIISELGSIPNTLILEPTLLLVEGLIERLQSYGIPCKAYSDSREHINGIVIAHPKSVGIDIDKSESYLDEVEILIGDECQHYQSTTWKSVVKACSNVDIRVGVSAYVISEDNLPLQRNLHELSKLTESEIDIIGSTGDILMYRSPKEYVQAGVLSSPKLIRINHEADDYVKNPQDWHQIRKHILESPNRSAKMAVISSYLSSLGYKSLILVNTKNHAYAIMKYIAELGFASEVRCTFGGGQYWMYDEELGKEIKVPKSEDSYQDYKDGVLSIFIGTSHIYEGADVPNLDAVILSSVGKQPRRVIQGIGRAIRRSKTGKYAYIIDFTDSCNGILRYHSNLRRSICSDLIGIDENSIFDNVSISEFKYIFNKLEGVGKYGTEVK